MSNEHKHNIFPVLRVECGLFGVQDDFFEEYLSLDERFVKNKKSTFFFHASGSSMMPLINPADVLIVDRSLKPKSGQICIFCLSGELVCKRYIKLGQQVILRSDNPVHKDIQVTEEMEMSVWGVVVAIARDVRAQ